jgi:hypothetical protein
MSYNTQRILGRPWIALRYVCAGKLEVEFRLKFVLEDPQAICARKFDPCREAEVNWRSLFEIMALGKWSIILFVGVEQSGNRELKSYVGQADGFEICGGPHLLFNCVRLSVVKSCAQN